MANTALETPDAPVAVETKVSDAGNWARTVQVTVPAADVDKEFSSVIGELAGQIRLPGFRPGKIPRNIIEKRYGDDIKKQVTANLLQRAVRSAIMQEKLDVVGEPILDPAKYNAEKGKAFTFDVAVEVRPTFDVANYKGLEIEQEEIELLPEEMDQAIDRIRDRFAEIVDAPADHAVVEQDVVSGPLRVLVDGNEVHKEDAQLLVMNGHVLGAYAHLGAKYLEGAKVGDKRTVEEVLGGHFPVEAHRGKKATLEFEVKSVKSRKSPPVDDELAKKIGLKDVAELKDKVRSSLLESVGSEIKKRTQYDLLDRVVAATPFELPKRLTEMMSNQTAQSSLQQLARMGMDAEALANEMKEITGDATQRAATEMRRYFVIDAICAKENLAVGEEDIDEEIVKQARSQNMRASEYYDRIVQDGSIQQIEADLKVRKALDFLVEQSNVKIVPRKPVDKNAGHEHAEHAPKADAHDHGHEHGHSHGHEHGHEHGH